MKNISMEQMQKMHTLLTMMSGGSDGLRDEGLLESALYGIEQTFMGEPLYPTLLERGARLGFSLMKNHAFIDGNKRIGMYVMLAFLEMNGIHISPSDDDVIRLGLDVASGNAGYENILDWIKGF
jgi:death-on-curing protein